MTPCSRSSRCEHLAEALAIRVQLRLELRPLDPAPAEHHRVEVPREREVVEATLARARVQRERFEVVVVEVAVGHRHRLAAVADHRPQRARVVLGTEQRDLPADELRVLAGPAQAAQQGHLRVDLADRVVAVDAHAVGLLRVVAGRAGEVALREHAVRSLAAGHPLAEHLVRALDVRGQLRPPARERGREIGMLGARRELELAQVGEQGGHVSNLTVDGCIPSMHTAYLCRSATDFSRFSSAARCTAISCAASSRRRPARPGR